MIPLVFVLSFIIGLISGIIGLYLLLALIAITTQPKRKRKPNLYMNSPIFQYNQDLSTEWLNTFVAKLYRESTKSDMLFPIVRHICEKVAESEKTINRLTLISFSLGQNPPSLKSVKLLPETNSDYLQFNFDFSPEFNVNLDLEMQVVARLNFLINAGCATFLQYVKGGLNLAIPRSYGHGRIFFSDDIDMSIVVGAALNEYRVNSDEYESTWNKIQKVAESFIRKINIKIPLKIPENNGEKKKEKKPKRENEDPTNSHKGFFDVKVSFGRPSDILFIN